MKPSGKSNQNVLWVAAAIVLWLIVGWLLWPKDVVMRPVHHSPGHQTL